MKKPGTIWQKFQYPAWVVGGIGAMVTAIVVANKYIGLPSKVEAAQETADSVRTDFDTYIAQQQIQAQLDSQRNELQQEFNKQLLQIQQQQAPKDDEPAWCCDQEGCWPPDPERGCQ